MEPTEEQTNRLDGATVVISGGASGIGKETATIAASHGATPVLVDLDDGVTAVAEGLRGRAVVGSVAETATWEEAFAVAGESGPLELVHLNAGLWGFVGNIEDTPLDVYQAVLDANVTGVMLGARAAVPALLAAGGGSIVATASIAGVMAVGPNPLYALTKHAVVGFVRSLADALGGRGITVNAVCPGIVDTPMTDEAGEELKGLIELIPVADVATTVLHLGTSGANGECHVVWRDREPFRWEFPGWERLAPPS